MRMLGFELALESLDPQKKTTLKTERMLWVQWTSKRIFPPKLNIGFLHFLYFRYPVRKLKNAITLVLTIVFEKSSQKLKH